MGGINTIVQMIKTQVTIKDIVKGAYYILKCKYLCTFSTIYSKNYCNKSR